MLSAREIALNLLQEWPHACRPADELFDERLAGAKLSPSNRGLAMELFYGWLRQKLALEFLQGRFVAKPPRAVVSHVLQLGLYQLHFLKTPAHAAVNESVALAKRHATVAEAHFVNAVLRRAAGGMSLKDAPAWVRVSHPRWLWERWVKQWGDDEARRLCEWNNEPPPVCVRWNSLRGTAPPTGWEPTAHPLCWRVKEPANLFSSEAWKRGEFYAQDPSTLAAVDVLDPQPGETVLDLCAAPGGKTTYIAQKMRNEGRIVATDSSSARLGFVGENCRRLGVSIVATLACDGTRSDRCLREATFDRVLVDAPCSNTGVMRRRPDLRWRVQAEEIGRLAETQGQLLAAAAKFTRRGGVLVYSTCSLEPEENERVTERFQESHPEFSLDATRSTFPPRDGADGSFVARFRRG